MSKYFFFSFIFLSVLSLVSCGSVNTTSSVDSESSNDFNNDETNNGGEDTGDSSSILLLGKSITAEVNQLENLNLLTLIDNFDSSKNYSFSISTPPLKGSAIIEDGELTYIPSGVSSGFDSLQITASNGNNISNVAQIEISIEGNATSSQTSELVLLDATMVATFGVEPRTLNLEDIIQNFDSSANYNFVQVALPSLGSVNFKGLVLTYTPFSGNIGRDVFTIRAGDGESSSNVASIDIEIKNETDAPPVMNDGNITTLPNTEVSLDLLTLLRAPHPVSGKVYTFSVSQNGQFGTAVVTGSTMVYTPITNVVNLTDTSLRILVKDDQNQTAEAHVNVSISNGEVE